MSETDTSVFVSHTNGSLGADKVIAALQMAFGEEAQGVAKLRLGVDRDNIEVGANWRQQIYEWLNGCCAAVVLISPESFTPGSWVANEAFSLMVRRARDDLPIVAVHIGDVTERVRTGPEFKASGIYEVKGIQCPNPPDDADLKAIVAEVRREVERVAPLALEGLGKSIAKTLASCKDSYGAMAAELGPAGTRHDCGDARHGIAECGRSAHGERGRCLRALREFATPGRATVQSARGARGAGAGDPATRD